MRNTNNKSLNDFFRAARDEANPELISDREAEQLLVNGTMRSLPTKQTIGQLLYERLFSTPLKIRITTIATSACIALGIIAFGPQTQQQTTDKNSVLSDISQPNMVNPNMVKSFMPHVLQSQSKRRILSKNKSIKLQSFTAKSNISLPLSVMPDSSIAIELTPQPSAQSEAVHPPLEVERTAPLSSDLAEEAKDPPYNESWYAGYLMVGAHQILNPFTATLPALDIINGIRIGHYETIGLRLGFEFYNPVIIAKYMYVELGIDSHTFFGDGAIRPFVWGQASLMSLPFAGGINPTGFGAYGINLAAGPGVQFRTAPGFSFMLDAGYQIAFGPSGAYMVHFGIGF